MLKLIAGILFCTIAKRREYFLDFCCGDRRGSGEEGRQIRSLRFEFCSSCVNTAETAPSSLAAEISFGITQV